MKMTVKEMIIPLSFIGMIVAGVWAVQDRVATPEQLEAAKMELVDSVQTEQNARVGSDYLIQYKYDRLDIERQMQAAKRILDQIHARAQANASWPNDSADFDYYSKQMDDLRQQKRDLEKWYRSIPK